MTYLLNYIFRRNFDVAIRPTLNFSLAGVAGLELVGCGGTGGPRIYSREKLVHRDYEDWFSQLAWRNLLLSKYGI